MKPSPKIVQGQAVFFLVAGVLMTVSAYMLEYEQRHGYLLELRSAALNVRLDLAAKIDPLTGLGNRRYLSAMIEKSRCERRLRTKKRLGAAPRYRPLQAI